MTGLSLRRAGATVIFWAAATKVIGFLREIVIAASYGTSQSVDVYLAAITIPAMIGTVLYYAFPNAFVPLFAAGFAHERQARRHAIRLIFAMVGLAAGFWVFAGPLSSLTASGFTEDARAQTAHLFKIAAGAVLLFTIGGLARSRLEAQKRFTQAGIGPLWSSATYIIAVSLFPDGREQTLVWAFVAGTAVIAVWNLIPGFKRERNTPDDAVADSDAAAGRWISIVLLISALGMFYTLIDRYYGSYLAGGSIAALQYANLLANQWVAICGGGLATAILPYLSHKVAAQDWPGASQIVDRAVRWALLATIPAAVITLLLGESIVTIVFERGNFDRESTILTGRLLTIYGAWMLPGVLCVVIGKVYYAMRSWRVVLTATSIALVTKIALSYWWVRAFGVTGLPGATAVSFGVYMAIVFAMLPKWCVLGQWKRWIQYTATLALVFSVACILGRGVSSWFEVLSPKGGACTSLATAAMTGVLALLLLGTRLGVVEVGRLRGAAGDFLRGRR